MSKLLGFLARWFLHAQRLFHVLVGLAFLLLAMASGYVSVLAWHDYHQAPSVRWYCFTIGVAVFTVVLIIFSLYTFFVKARSVR